MDGTYVETIEVTLVSYFQNAPNRIDATIVSTPIPGRAEVTNVQLPVDSLRLLKIQTIIDHNDHVPTAPPSTNEVRPCNLTLGDLKVGTTVVVNVPNQSERVGCVRDTSVHTHSAWVHFYGDSSPTWVSTEHLSLANSSTIKHDRKFFISPEDHAPLPPDNETETNSISEAPTVPRRASMMKMNHYIHVEGTDARKQNHDRPQRIPRVPSEEETTLPKVIQQRLRARRVVGETMKIPPEQIWVHEDTLTDGEYSGTVWYNSYDVGKVVAKTIPRAMTDGYPRANEFTSPELPQHAPVIEKNFFDAQKMVDDLSSFSKDRTLLHNLLCGSPQSFCGLFDTILHRNLPMTEAGRKKVRESILKDIALKRCSHMLSLKELLEIVPIALKSPTGVIPKNSGEKCKIEKGTHSLDEVKTRTILHASKKGPNGQSVNSQTSYETLHTAEFIRLQDVEKAILDAVIRLKELGFEDHTDRILVWKADIKSAYRLMLTAVADRWLGVHGIDDEYVVEHVAQFGQKASVTMFHRFIYAMTSLMSEPSWAQKWFPEMSLPKSPQPNTKRPTRESIETELQKFRDDKTGNGILDPDVFCWVAWYLDDMVGVCIDVRNDISEPLDPDNFGVRNPLGKAVTYFLHRYKIPENLEKREHDNDPLFMGNKKPVILGIQVDLNALRVYVREDYKENLVKIIDTWLSQGPSTSHSAAEWGLLEGRLGFTMMVYPHFRCFLREIWMTYAVILKTEATHWCAKPVILENLECMRDILQSNPGRSMYHNRQWRTGYQRGLEFCFKSPSTNDILHDASTGYGFGYMNAGDGTYYYRKWKGKELILAKQKKIYVLEAAAMFITFVINAESLSESKINMCGDNEGLVASFHWCGSSVPIVNAIIREFVKLLSHADIVLNCDKEKFQTSWIDTHEMEGADALSRDDLKAFHEYVEREFKGKTFTKVPATDARVILAEKLWQTILDRYVKEE